MLSLLLLGAGTVAHAKCYDGGGNFNVAMWPICHEATPSLTVYSGLSADGELVKLGLHAQGHSKGWSSIGFSGNGGMKGASQIVVRLDQDQWVAEDRFSLDFVTPTLDPEQNVRLIFAQDNGANTSWGVVIPKNSCDANDYSTESVSRAFLWALGASHAFNQHSSRGQFHANLINGTVPLTALTDTTSVDVKMRNASVVSATSDASNPYICGIFDLRELLPGRDFDQKVHVAKFSPYLDPVTAPYVHHMILYACDSNAGFVHGSIVADCQSMPAGCNTFKWVWAVGSPDLQLPDDVGMPVGEGSYFVALQMHYYNPRLLKINDTSGVTLSFTTANRAIDAAIMQLNGGTSPIQRPSLPANSARFTLEPPLVVPAVCTNQWVEPITLVGAAHHMHLLGVHQSIEVARGGVNLGMMRYERLYDFKHQSMEEPLVHQLMQGDEIKVTCDYSTLGKLVPTVFGENTDNEMCWSALMFYPAQSFSGAFVLPSADATLVACQNQSALNSSLSMCADTYFADPSNFMSSKPSNHSASFICNVLPRASPSTFASVQASWPTVCPPCYLNSSCTDADLLEHGQSECVKVCSSRYNASTFPDLSSPAVFHAHRTYCDGPNKNVYVSDEVFPPLPPCAAKGDLAKSQSLVASVLANQHACPNLAIKAVVSSCSAADLSLVGGKTVCQPQCANATAELSASFQDMVPVPSADQQAQCVKDYNSTWTPASAGGWAVLETRLRSGTTICDAASLPPDRNSGSLAASIPVFVALGFACLTQ